jgi:hypothetical protein
VVIYVKCCALLLEFDSAKPEASSTLKLYSLILPVPRVLQGGETVSGFTTHCLDDGAEVMEQGYV